jgi:hypothetical protein
MRLVLVLNVRVVDLNRLVLLLSRGKDRGFPLVARLLLVDRSELLLGLFNVVEGSPLVHAVFADSSVSGNHDVQFAVRVEDHLNLVEDKIPVRAILQIHLGHIGVPRELGLVVVDLVLLLSVEFLIDGNIVQFFLFLKDFFSALTLSFLKEDLSVLGEVMDELGPLACWSN